MGAAAAGAVFELVFKVIGMVGDARAWDIHVRLCELGKANGKRDVAELLEAWVHAAVTNPLEEFFKGQRREMLRMACYEWEEFHGTDPATPLLRRAADLYTWGVKAERADSPFPPETPGGHGGFGDEPHRRIGRIPTKPPPKVKKGRRR
jgi:hypothetical protein